MEPNPSGRPKKQIVNSLSPRAKIALKAVLLGGLRHKEAAAIAGVHPQYISQLKSTDVGQEYMDKLGEKLDEKHLETSDLLARYAREGVEKLAGLMRFSSNENIVLRAASDLADRGPSTRKVQKHEVEAFTLSGKDITALRQSIVEAAEMRAKYSEAVTGDFIKVPLELPHGGNESDV